MDARQIYLAQHDRVHSAAVAGAPPGSRLTDGAYKDLTDLEIGERLPGHASIAWLLSHLAR